MSPNKEPSFVVVISGTSGSGKSTIAQKVADLLGDAVVLYSDDYASLSRQPADLAKWLEDGADMAHFKNPELLEALHALRSGISTLSPRGGRLQPARFVVMEEPYGRERPGVNELVDLAIYLDLPLEIALARKLLREIEWMAESRGAEDAIAYVRDYLSWYLQGRLRDTYLAVNQKALQSCDLVLDGMRPLDELTDEIAKAVRARAESK